MSVEKKVPEVRFEEFSGEWEEKPFGACFVNIPNNTLSRADLNYKTGLAKNIHYGDVLIKFGEVLDASSEPLPFITNNDVANKLKHAALRNGDIIIADAAEDSIVGKCTELFNIDEQLILSGLHTIAVRPALPFASKYLGYYLNSSSYHDQLLSLMQGTKVLSISKTALQNTNVRFPRSSEEQAQIGNYFQKIDTLLNQHQQKHDKLSNIKNAMLEKMFPKQGETIPEIRFKGFSEEWVENNLGELIDIRSAARVHKEQWTEAGVPFFRTSDVVSIYKGHENTKAYIPQEVYNGLSEKIGKVKKDDLLITGGGSIGIPYLVPNDNSLYFKDADLLWLKNNKKINGYFLYTFFFSTFFKQHIKNISHTGTIAHYTIEQAKATPINTCSEKEQTAIGNYFQKLDALINQHQQQITKLTNIKQACLSKMFV